MNSPSVPGYLPPTGNSHSVSGYFPTGNSNSVSEYFPSTENSLSVPGYFPPTGNLHAGSGCFPPTGNTNSVSGYFSPNGRSSIVSEYFPPTGNSVSGCLAPIGDSVPEYLPPTGNSRSVSGYLPPNGNSNSVSEYFPPTGNSLSVSGYLAPIGDSLSVPEYFPPTGNSLSVSAYFPPTGDSLSVPGYFPPNGNSNSVSEYFPPSGNSRSVSGYLPPGNSNSVSEYFPPSGNSLSVSGYLPPGNSNSVSEYLRPTFDSLSVSGYLPPNGDSLPVSEQLPSTGNSLPVPGYLPPTGNSASVPGYLHPTGNSASVPGYLPPTGNSASVPGYLPPTGNSLPVPGYLPPTGNSASVPGYIPPTDVHSLLDDNQEEIFARKVFVGGLPIDISEGQIGQCFSKYGTVVVDWPRRTDGTSCRDNGRPGRTMTGYVFLVFEKEYSVQALVNACSKDDDKYYLLVSSPTMPLKPVQVRPWRLSDMDYMPDRSQPLDPRRTVFIGGVPRPTKASELAACMSVYGPVCYVGIDIDPELKYPKGAARVTFLSTEFYMAAIRGRFVHVRHGDVEKRVEIKPYVMDEQMCDECLGAKCQSQYATYFCGDPVCLQYYCEHCWDKMHCQPSSGLRVNHRVTVRQGDQTRILDQPPHHAQSQSRGRIRHSNSQRGYYQQ